MKRPLFSALRIPAAGLLSLAICLAVVAGCRKSETAGSTGGGSSSTGSAIGYTFPHQAGPYTVLGILTDNKDSNQAKSNAEGALVRHPQLAGMVGLWAYNPPMILSALRSAGREGQVKVVGFDEHEETLQAIGEGRVVGTIVQQPYAFGYRSVELLAAIVRGQEVEIPESRMIFIPHQVIREDNVQQFAAEVEAIKAGRGPELPPLHDHYETSQPVRLAYVTNSVDPFWSLADFGCRRASEVFQAHCSVQMPSTGTVEEQKRYIETNITQGYDAMAISPIDPANQAPMINEACEKMVVICHDSDAPNTNREFYLGTSNYLAGRAAGELLKEALPEGGEVMIFVGRLEVLNAQERSKGLIDALEGKPIPAIFASADPDSSVKATPPQPSE